MSLPDTHVKAEQWEQIMCLPERAGHVEEKGENGMIIIAEKPDWPSVNVNFEARAEQAYVQQWMKVG